MLLDEIYQLSSELIGETSTQLEKLCQIVKVRLENKLKYRDEQKTQRNQCEQL